MKLTKEEALNKIKELEQYISNVDWQFEDGDVFKNGKDLLFIKKIGDDQFKCRRIYKLDLFIDELLKMYACGFTGQIQTYDLILWWQL